MEIKHSLKLSFC